jgi:hypothetical protein
MKVLLSISAVAALLALVGPAAALSGGGPDDRAVPRGTTFGQTEQGGMLPDDRALPRNTTSWIVPKNLIGGPDDRSFARSTPSERVAFVRVSSSAFDWTDAGVGAAGGFGIALVLLGAGLMAVRRGAGGPVTA